MTISTTYRRMETDTQGEHIEVRMVYSGSREEIDGLEEKMRVSIGDGTLVEIPEGMKGEDDGK